jgi:hypothetical protein
MPVELPDDFESPTTLVERVRAGSSARGARAGRQVEIYRWLPNDSPAVAEQVEASFEERSTAVTISRRSSGGGVERGRDVGPTAPAKNDGAVVLG